MKIYLYVGGDGSCPIELDPENISLLYLEGGKPYLVVYNPLPVIEEIHKKGYCWKAECSDDESTEIQLEKYEWRISFNWETAKFYSGWEEETKIGEN